MAAPTKPQKVKALGKDSWWWVPAIADMTAPSVGEINAAGGVNISCYLLAEQGGATSDAQKEKVARLLCETATTEELGEQSWSLADIQGVFDPQAAANSDGKKAFENFRVAREGFLVRRQGVEANSETPEAVAGQFFDVFQVGTGAATPDKTDTGNAGIYSFSVPVALRGHEFNVAAV